MSDFRFSLDTIEVPIPCAVPWESMRGSDRVRHCGQCRQNVYQLSEMSRDEAEALIRRMEGKLCVQFYRRGDGSMVTRDCAAVRLSRAVRTARTFVVFGVLSVLSALSFPWIAQLYQAWATEKEKERQSRLGGEACFPLPSKTPEIAPPPREVPKP